MNTDSNESDKNINPKQALSPWWMAGVEIFSRVSAWIAAPLILALFAGKSLDKRFGTEPLLLLSFAGIGFLISAFGIIRTIRRYIQKTKITEKKNK